MLRFLQAPAVFNVNAAVAALYSHHMTTGLVVHMGEQNAHIVPVYEGCVSCLLAPLLLLLMLLSLLQLLLLH